MLCVKNCSNHGIEVVNVQKFSCKIYNQQHTPISLRPYKYICFLLIFFFFCFFSFFFLRFLLHSAFTVTAMASKFECSNEVDLVTQSKHGIRTSFILYAIVILILVDVLQTNRKKIKTSCYINAIFYHEHRNEKNMKEKENWFIDK